MKILDRYLIKKFIFPFLYFLALFIFLYIIIDLFEHLDQILKSKTPFLILLKFYLLNIPVIFVQIAPLTALIATLYTLGKLNRYGEIVAMRSSGVSVTRIISPFLFLALFISAVVFAANEKIVPGALLVSQQLRQLHIENSSPIKQPKIINNVALFGAQNRIFYVNKFDIDKKVMEDLTVLQFDEKNILLLKMTAKKAQWENDKWMVSDGVVFGFDREGNIIGEPIAFDKRHLKIDEGPRDFMRYEARTEFMSYRQLSNYIKKITGAGEATINKLLVDLHYKRAFAFITLVAVLIGLPFGLIKYSHGFLMGLGIAFIISICYYALLAVTLALGKAGILPPLLSAWCTNILFSISAIILLKTYTRR